MLVLLSNMLAGVEVVKQRCRMEGGCARGCVGQLQANPAAVPPDGAWVLVTDYMVCMRPTATPAVVAMHM